MTFFKNILTTKIQLIILLLLAWGLNINTLFNDYAVDDPVILTENSLVKKGITGIPEILTTEYFYGFEKKEGGLPGGRYRPVALIVFAIEYQLFGLNPMVSHFINVLLFSLLIALLFKLLKNYIFKNHSPYLAFITCLLFVAHPIHTEVIANVKSRDELIVFILLIITSFAYIIYCQKKYVLAIVVGLGSYFLALMTRESAMPFIGIVPLIAYFFFDKSILKSLKLAIPLIFVFIAYMVIRLMIIGSSPSQISEIGNAPFLYATATQAFATKVYILLKYIWLMVYPHPLASDYGYNQIPYINMNSVPFFLSSIIIIGLITFAIATYKKRSIISFSILYFFITIFLFSNFIIDIGAPLAERLLFEPSLAFCIVLAILYLTMADRFFVLANCILLTIMLLFSAKTISRNRDWKNDFTLYTTDVNNVPGSIRANKYSALNFIEKAVNETNKDLKNDYLNRAVMYDQRILHLIPNNAAIIEDFAVISDIYFNEGNEYCRTGKINEAILNYKKALRLNENNIDAWYNLSKNYTFIHDTLNAEITMKNVLKLNPSYKLK